MSLFEKFRESWLRPALFFGNNPISLAGGAITTASGITMISYWLAELSGHLSDNPYLGIIFFLILPVLVPAGPGAHSRRRVSSAAESCRKPARFPPHFPGSISTTASSVTGSTSFSSPPSSISSSSPRPAITARSIWIRRSSAAAPAT